MQKLEDLKVGDVINEFEVIELLNKNTKNIQKYIFRCIHCGHTIKNCAANIRRKQCDGCKILANTKQLYISLKDKIIKGYRCIGYDIKLSSNNRTIGILIFECVNCGNTIKLSANSYKSFLKYCSCISRIGFNAYKNDKEEIGDFIITKTTNHISNSRNVDYEAKCKHCGYTLHGQHCKLVKIAKEGCKHHVYFDDKYIKKSEYRKIYLKERKKTTEKAYKMINKRAETALDKIYKDFKLYEKIHDRLDNELFHLNNDPKTKKKYEDIIKNMAKTLLRWCE